jgi:predicted naringenin-chalcone synthase
LLPLTVATPLVNVIAVGVPNAVATPELFVTVGDVTGSVEEFAPEKVSVLLPVYEVAGDPRLSARIVKLLALPAIWEVLPVITNFVGCASAAPALRANNPSASMI